MQVFRFSSLILVLGVIFSCKKDPKACIDMSAENVNVGQEVTFKSCSENALSYDWYFITPVGAPEDSLGNSELQFTNSFSVPGQYTVVHVAFEKFSFLGASDTTTKTLIVN